jgi:hypothetical protein
MQRLGPNPGAGVKRQRRKGVEAAQRHLETSCDSVPLGGGTGPGRGAMCEPRVEWASDRDPAIRHDGVNGTGRIAAGMGNEWSVLRDR